MKNIFRGLYLTILILALSGGIVIPQNSHKNVNPFPGDALNLQRIINKFVNNGQANTVASLEGSAANWLVTQQLPSGGFPWTPGGTVTVNTQGPSARGLLKAYQQTGNTSYLNAAVAAGNYLVPNYPRTYTDSDPRFAVHDLLFLEELSQVTGNPVYANFVQTNFWNKLTNGTYGELNNLDAAAFGNLILNDRNSQGIVELVPWDLSATAIAAKIAGENSISNALMTKILEALNATTLSNNTCDVIGLAGAVWASAVTGFNLNPSSGRYAVDNSTADLANRLSLLQRSDGAWVWSAANPPCDPADITNGDLQTTAFALLALKAQNYALYSSQVAKGFLFIKSLQQPSGQLLCYQGAPPTLNGSVETHAEALSALIEVLPTQVFADDNWATGINIGDDPDGAGPAVSFGFDAFSTVQSAIDGVVKNGTVNVAAGTYSASPTLNINKELILTGENQATTFLDAHTNGTGYGILISASNVTLQNFSIWPPVTPTRGTSSGGGYAIHASNTPNPLLNININHITVEDGNRSGIDINTVNNLSLSYITSKNAAYGNGVNLSGVNGAVISNISTSGNAWGGIAIYVSKPGQGNRGSQNIVIDGASCSNAEMNKIYSEDEAGLFNTNNTVNGFEYYVKNLTGNTFTWYQVNLHEAFNMAFTGVPSYGKGPSSGSYIRKISDDEFYVCEGLLGQTSINAASPGEVINYSSGHYVENLIISKDLTLKAAPGSFPVLLPQPGNIVLNINSGANVTVDGVTITNAAIGINLVASHLNLVNSNIISNINGIFIDANSTADIHFNNIQDISTVAITSTSTHIIDARNNWWGDASGPSGPIADAVSGVPANGTGELINGIIQFDPWTGATSEGTTVLTVTEPTPPGGLDLTSQSETGMDANIQTAGAGEANLYLSQYTEGENPGSGFSSGTNNFYDVFLDDPSGVTTQLVVKFYYTGQPNPDPMPIKFYNGTVWLTCSNQTVHPTGGGNGYVEVLFTEHTIPALSELTALPFGFGAPSNPVIAVGDVTSFTDAIITVPVSIVQSDNGGSKGYQGQILYDPQYFQFLNESYGPGTLFNTYGFLPLFLETIPGVIKFAAVSPNEMDSDGIMFNLLFKIICQDTGSSKSITSAEFKAIEPIENVFDYFSGTITWTNPPVTSHIRGDANQDYFVDFNDAVIVNGHLTGQITLAGQALLNANADLNDGITTNDLYFIIYFAQNGTWPEIPSLAQGNLEINNAEYVNNGYVNLPVSINSSLNLHTCEVLFHYDPAKINYQAFSSALQNTGSFVYGTELEPGTAKFTFASPETMNGNVKPGKLVLKFKEGVIPEGSVLSTEYSLNNQSFQAGPVITFTITGIEEKNEKTIPVKFEAAQNYPNPFNPTTTIEFGIPEESHVTIVIYDMLGKEVKTLLSDYIAAGTYRIDWNGENESGQKVVSGTYLYRIVAGNNIKTMKMLLLK